MASLPLPEDWRDPRSTIDPKELSARLRAITPDTDEHVEMDIRCVEVYRDKLIELGGRPTRAIRTEPIWRADEHEEGVLHAMNADLDQECNILAEDLMDHHWGEESNKFEEELHQWQQFREYQQSANNLATSTVLQLQDTNEQLSTILKRLSDWQAFEDWQQRKVNRAINLKSQCRQALEKAQRNEAALRETDTYPTFWPKLEPWVSGMRRRRRDLEASKKRLLWIKSQYPEILAEAVESLAAKPRCLQELEKIMKMQVDAIHQELEQLGQRQLGPVGTPNLCTEQVQRIHHLNLETSRLREERREWKSFLGWRKRQPSFDGSESPDNLHSCGNPPVLALWEDYVSYRRREFEKAKSWVECWRSLEKWRMREAKEAPPLEGPGWILSHIDYARANGVDAQKDVDIAQTRLDESREILLEISARQIPMDQYGCSPGKTLLSPPPTASASPDVQSKHEATCSTSSLYPGSPSLVRKRKGSSEDLEFMTPNKLAKTTHDTSQKKPTKIPKILKLPHVTAKTVAASFELSNPNPIYFEGSLQTTRVLGEVPKPDAIELEAPMTEFRDADCLDTIADISAASPELTIAPESKPPLPSMFQAPTHPTKVYKAAQRKATVNLEHRNEQQTTLLLTAASLASGPRRNPAHSSHPHLNQNIATPAGGYPNPHAPISSFAVNSAQMGKRRQTKQKTTVSSPRRSSQRQRRGAQTPKEMEKLLPVRRSERIKERAKSSCMR